MRQSPPPPFSNVQLGLLDDDDFSVSLVRTTASNCGLRNLKVFPDERAALAALRGSAKPDIMLVHHRPPNGTGIDFCRFIRDRTRSPDPFLAIIMISAGATRPDVIAARDAGIDEFLATPFSSKQFTARISSIVFNRRGFVDIGGFFGPDRRRGAIAEMLGQDRRVEPTTLIDPRTRQSYIG